MGDGRLAPIFIVSKGRTHRPLTIRALDKMGVDFSVIVEPEEVAAYANVAGRERVLALPHEYKEEYDLLDGLGLTKSTGPGPARNFAWDQAALTSAPYHWVMDDNIRQFSRRDGGRVRAYIDATPFSLMEQWAAQWENLAMLGPEYQGFAEPKRTPRPLRLNTRIYSCNLIRTDVPFRWRGRYNEDTILSLDMLEAGWVTALFHIVLQLKQGTQRMAGGNTADFYTAEGTGPKTAMLIREYPGVTRWTNWRGRPHHRVDYSRYASNFLRRKPDMPPLDLHLKAVRR